MLCYSASDGTKADLALSDLKRGASVDGGAAGVERVLHFIRHLFDFFGNEGVAVVDHQRKGVCADFQVVHSAMPFVLE